MEDDTAAALEYSEYEESLCSGCGRPRHESFDIAREEAYDAEALKCHACATRDRKARNAADQENVDMAGIYFAIKDAEGDSAAARFAHSQHSLG